VGVSTAVADDPGLNCRIEGVRLEQQPRPIILDPGFRWEFKRNARVLETARAGKGKAPWILVSSYTGRDSAMQRREWLEEVGGKLIVLDPPSQNGCWSWNYILQKLQQEDLQSIMVEGGGGVINNLLSPENLALIDSVIVTMVPVYLGRGGVNVSPASRKTVPAVTFKDVQWNVLGRDVVMAARADTASS
jgi:2,5-diamino-6-(ribosylamino)-4(3H)-pyrimidinone 5'-phosphate reductase